MAGRIPQDFLDRLLSCVDLAEIVDARVPLRKAGREYVACCPFHNEKTPSFTVSTSKQFFHCFGCGAHGNAISFLMEYERLGFPDAVEELARTVGLEVPRSAGVHPDEHGDLIALAEQAAHFFRRQLSEHPARRKVVDYLQRRGLDDGVIDAFGIGYAPPAWDGLLKALTGAGANLKDIVEAGLAVEHDNGHCYDRFRDRVMFPIRDRRGRTIAFGGRALGEATPKYMNSPETPFFHKGQELYGLYEARASERQLQRLLVVEGYMDVVALAQKGIRNSVATLGTATTTEHLERLFRAVKDIAFCFDGDRAGREAAWRALENALPLMRGGRQAAFLFLPEGEDPDTLVRKEGRQVFEQRLTQAVPLSEYFFQRLTTDVDMTSLDGRARLVEQALPLLRRLPDGVYRDMLMQRLADITGAGKTVVERRLGSVAPVAAIAKRSHSDRNVTRTPVRRAIALLLNRTDLAQLAGDLSRFRDIPVPGVPLLVEIIELLQNNPHISVGALVERYRGNDTSRIIERIAQWKPEISENLLEAEFLGILENLEKRYSVERQLLDKAARGDLNAEEKEMLRKLGSKTEVKT